MTKLRKHITLSPELFNFCCIEAEKFNDNVSAFISYCIHLYRENAYAIKPYPSEQIISPSKEMVKQEPVKQEPEVREPFVPDQVKSAISNLFNLE